MIKQIIFDIGGVITKTNFKQIHENLSRRLGLPEDFVHEYVKQRREPLLVGDFSAEDLWRGLRKAGANPDLDYNLLWIEEGLKNRKINQELLDLIKQLRKKYIVGTLTNLAPQRIPLDNAINLYEHFDYAILSCVEHQKKPEASFYELALKKGGTKADEAIFIDDNETNVQTAEKLGMKGIFYIYPDNISLVNDLRKYGVDI